MTASSDIAFSPAVKAEQQRRGSRAGYARLEEKRGWPTVVTPELAELIGATRTFYLATASKRWATLHPAPWWAERLPARAR